MEDGGSPHSDNDTRKESPFTEKKMASPALGGEAFNLRDLIIPRDSHLSKTIWSVRHVNSRVTLIGMVFETRGYTDVEEK